MTNDEFQTLPIDVRIELLHTRDSLSSARQMLFQTAKLRPELAPLYERSQALYEEFCAMYGIPAEPVFDRDTYVPNPDRWG